MVHISWFLLANKKNGNSRVYGGIRDMSVTDVLIYKNVRVIAA